jgi:hypothetical protein
MTVSRAQALSPTRIMRSPNPMQVHFNLASQFTALTAGSQAIPGHIG